jgi:hypothetical protein
MLDAALNQRQVHVDLMVPGHEHSDCLRICRSYENAHVHYLEPMSNSRGPDLGL